MRPKIPLITSLAIFTSVAPVQAEDNYDWQTVDAALGRKPAVTADVRRYGFPRSDLNVTRDGVAIQPTLALGGWIAFKPVDGKAVAMGDLVLTESEVNPVVAKLREGGLEITGIHNHLLRTTPPIIYVHVAGHGDPSKLAIAIRDALAVSKTPQAMLPPAVAAPMDLNTAALDETLGAKGQTNGGVYQFAIPRRDQVAEHGVQLNPPGSMGVATAINFQPTGGGKAAITGDFVLRSEEVNPVILELQANGIEVTAVHSHMLDEQPRLLFLHFWANDDALKLAKGLRAALDRTARAKS
jgi:hypothetical protein